MMPEKRKPTCDVPDCRLIKRNAPWCRKHADERPHCPSCGGLMSDVATLCRSCTASKQGESNGKHASASALAQIRNIFKGCENRQGDKRFYTAQMARDLVAIGRITAAEARRLCPYM